MNSRLHSGPPAGEQVAADPFWSVVRRRHPDVDIVLLPPVAAGAPAAPSPPPSSPPPSPPSPPAPLVDAAEETARADELADRWWRAVVGGDPTEATGRWLRGSTAGTWRRETTRRLEGADLATTLDTLGRAERTLVEAGWHVLAPDTGMPRLLASHTEGGRRTELLLVLAPTLFRLVLRLRTPDVELAEHPS